jgi:type VI secretion system protein ImpM
MPGDVRPMVGLCGKLPARGDFVRVGLPRDFVDCWDEWLSGVMSAARLQFEETWLPAFLEAPVWRFSLPAGLCGGCAVLGVSIPSVDKAGRYFPLTLAAAAAVPGFAADIAAEAWLDRCQQSGLSALEQDAEPGEIAVMLGEPVLASTEAPCRESAWWSEGGPRVAPARLKLNGLPDAETYALMLGLL